MLRLYAKIFSTFSKRGVARGLHYQYSILSNRRFTCYDSISGTVLDFLVKFDPHSSKVLAIQEEQLGPQCKNNSLLIEGNGEHCHGFVALNDCVCLYASSQSYLKEDDSGYDLLSLNYDFTKIMHDIGVNNLLDQTEICPSPRLLTINCYEYRNHRYTWLYWQKLDRSFEAL